MEGKKVLLVDADPQGSLSISLGFPQPDKIPTTIATVMVITNTPIEPREGIYLAAGLMDKQPGSALFKTFFLHSQPYA